jgi:hypothetical protein
MATQPLSAARFCPLDSTISSSDTTLLFTYSNLLQRLPGLPLPLGFTHGAWQVNISEGCDISART